MAVTTKKTCYSTFWCQIISLNFILTKVMYQSNFMWTSPILSINPHGKLQITFKQCLCPSSSLLKWTSQFPGLRFFQSLLYLLYIIHYRLQSGSFCLYDKATKQHHGNCIFLSIDLQVNINQVPLAICSCQCVVFQEKGIPLFWGQCKTL